MPRRPFLFTITDMKRAMKAAEDKGWKSVTFTTKDGVEITLGKDAPEKPVEDKPKYTL